MLAFRFANVAQDISRKMVDDGEGNVPVDSNEEEEEEGNKENANGDPLNENEVENGDAESRPEPAPQDKLDPEGETETKDETEVGTEPETEADAPEADEKSESSALAARQALLEARAINEATASADSSYVPSPAMLAETDPNPLMQQVDGTSVKNYTGTPNVYQAKDIPLAVRSKVEVPIYITSGGSVVEFSVESATYDIAFGVVAEREDKETVVKPVERVDANIKPCYGKFLVGTVPCVLIFTFDNEYSWFTEKQISYKVTVTPPSKENVLMGRRRRAKSALKSVEEDNEKASARLETAVKNRETLTAAVAELEQRLAEQKESLEAVIQEEDFLKNRVDLRTTQRDMLQNRLADGWEDED